MSDEEERNGSVTERESTTPQREPGAEGSQERTTTQRRGVRIAELGRVPVEVNLGEDESVSIQELIEDGHLSGDPDVQIYVNMRQITDTNERVSNGANIVTVRKIVAGDWEPHLDV